MHMRGEPRTMQVDPAYDDVVAEVKRFLEERLAFAVSAGIREELVCLDPGHRVRQDGGAQLRARAQARRAARLGRPLLVGFSRKSSLGALTGAARGSAAASVGAAVSAYERGATILRAHDVREHVEALAAARAVAGA